MNTFAPVFIRFPSILLRAICNGGSAPKPPGFNAFVSKGAIERRRPKASPPRKPGTALGARPRVALSSVSVKQHHFITQRLLLARCISQNVLDIGYILKKEKNNTEQRYTEKVRPSVLAHGTPDTGQMDRTECEMLEQILEDCELWVLPEEVHGAFRNAIERLFFSESFTVGKVRLPQERVRSHLWLIDGMVLQDAYQKLRANTVQKVKNSTAYLMSTLFNAIHEGQSDLLVDPFLNAMQPGARGVGS